MSFSFAYIASFFLVLLIDTKKPNICGHHDKSQNYLWPIYGHFFSWKIYNAFFEEKNSGMFKIDQNFNNKKYLWSLGQREQNKLVEN